MSGPEKQRSGNGCQLVPECEREERDRIAKEELLDVLECSEFAELSDAELNWLLSFIS